MARKKLTAEEKREQFVRSLQKRIQDKNHYEQADAIVWAIEQMMSGAPEPDQVEEPEEQDDTSRK